MQKVNREHSIPVPHYLLSKGYEEGIVEQIDFPGEGKPLSAGWVTKQWVPSVQQPKAKYFRELL